MARKILTGAALASAAAVAALAAALPGAAATPTLTATVTDDSVISLATARGRPVRTLRAGTYVVVVRDQTGDHNFRLRGRGINKATGVGATETTTWRIRLARGRTYTFQCDPHASEMRGSFRVR